jgi:hypothetical protein
MKETGIMFSTPMVQALPHKSQTRRTRGLEVINENPDGWNYAGTKNGISVFQHKDIEDYTLEIKCPYGVKGDRLWVKETWQDYCPIWQGAWCGHGNIEDIKREHQPVYKADSSDKWLRNGTPPLKWKSAMFMFRWASRHLLELVEEPIPQRLWDITEEDAKAEGIYANSLDGDFAFHWESKNSGYETARFAYQELWNSINVKRYPWSGNYWDWKLVFKEIKP